jgi:hypothetical protein
MELGEGGMGTVYRATDQLLGRKTVIALWIYEDTSMAVVYLDLLYRERCTLWHAPDLQHFNIDYVEQLRQRLSTLNLRVPDDLDRVLSKK